MNWIIKGLAVWGVILSVIGFAVLIFLGACMVMSRGNIDEDNH